MQRILLLFTITMLSLLNSGNAQTLSNPGFEQMNDTLPADWTYGYGSSLSNSYTNSGNNAMAVWNWYYYATGWTINGYHPDLKDQQFNWALGGEPIDQKVAGLTGYYYFDTIGSGYGADTAYIAVLLKRYDTTAQKMDTVGFGEGFMLPYEMTNGLHQFDIDIIDLMPGTEPDSVAIFIASRNNDNACLVSGDGNCLYLYVDDLAFRTGPADTTTSITNVFEKQLFSMFPNPAVSQLSVMSSEAGSIRLLNMQGRLVFEEQLNTGRQQLDISTLAKGVYVVQVSTASGKQYHQKLLKNE